MITTLFEYLSYFVSFIALLGAYLNSNLDIRGFYCWVLSNAFFLLFNIHNRHYGIAVLYTCYLVTSLNGIIKFNKNQKGYRGK